MPCSHLSSCIQASYSILVLQMKMRVRGSEERASLGEVLACLFACIGVLCVHFYHLLVLR